MSYKKYRDVMSNLSYSEQNLRICRMLLKNKIKKCQHVHFAKKIMNLQED